MMDSRFFRFFYGPILMGWCLALLHGLNPWLPPGAGSLATAYSILVVVCLTGGMRASLASGLMIGFYAFFIAEDYNSIRAVTAAANALIIAGVIGWGKRRLTEQTLEAGELQVKVHTNLARAEIAEAVAPNGNRAKIRGINEMLIGLIKDLDKVPLEIIKKTLFEIQNHLSNTLTVFDLWHGLAEDRRQALLKLEEDFRGAHGYDFRVSEEIQAIKQLQKEALSRIYEIERQGKRDETDRPGARK